MMLWIWSVPENRPDLSGSPLLAEKTKSKEANYSYNPAFSEATRKESQWCNRLGIVVILIGRFSFWERKSEKGDGGDGAGLA
jgi:hypothetical protein